MTAKSDTETFIKKARAVHGNKFDYSKTSYARSNEKVIIICSIHGEFAQTPNNHLRERGCAKCKPARTKKTFLERYGVDNPAKIDSIKSKIKSTRKEKYGSPHGRHQITEKARETCNKKYGVNYSGQAESVKAKSIKTCLAKYGTEYFISSKMARDHRKRICLERYGTESPLAAQEIRIKSRKTFLVKYGVEYSSQNREIHDKIQKSGFKTKRFKLPSGAFVDLQGYEPQVLKYLLENEIYEETDFDFVQIPTFKYADGRRYHPDFYVPKERLVIEVKSRYTYSRFLKTNLQKKRAVLAAGFRFYFYVWTENRLDIL